MYLLKSIIYNIKYVNPQVQQGKNKARQHFNICESTKYNEYVI